MTSSHIASITNSLCATGIAGIDTILQGGLPDHQSYLLQGVPGAGKTTFALQFLLEGVRLGEKVLFVSLSENTRELKRVAESHAWKLDGIDVLEHSAIERLVEMEAENTVFHPSEFELSELMGIIKKKVQEIQPHRIAFDSIAEIRNFAHDPLRFRRQVLALKQYLLKQGAAVLMIDDMSQGSSDMAMETMMHGVMTLEMQFPDFGAVQRRVKVTKMRGHQYLDGYHNFRICPGGIEAFPRIRFQQFETKTVEGQLQSGLPAIDTLLGGGVDRGTSNLFMGPAGTGKTITSIQYAHAALKAGEKVLICLFEETLRSYLKKARKISLDLEPFIAQGNLRVMHIDAAELMAGQLAHEIREPVEKEDFRVLVFDSLNGFLDASHNEVSLTLQMHELLLYLSEYGVTSFLIMAESGFIGQKYSSTARISYLADTIMLFRYFEFQGKVKKALSVIKKRMGPHENSIRELQITSKGLRVGPPLEQFSGVLTGVPTFVGDGGKIIIEPESKDDDR